MKLTDAQREALELRARCANLVRENRLQAVRLDKIRNAVAAFLDGELSRQGLERAFNDTDCSHVALEGE